MTRSYPKWSALIVLFTCAHFSLAQVPLPWVSSDIGSTAISGDADYNAADNTFTVSGSGNVQDGSSYSQDKFHYVYQQVTGNFEFSARIIDFNCSNAQAKAGLMVRTSLDDDAPHHMIAAQIHEDKEMAIFRWNPGQWPFTKQYFPESFITPKAFRILRYENRITVQSSWDEVEWKTLHGLILNDADGPVYVGMAVCSQSDTTLATATFGNVSVKPLQLPYTTSWLGNSHAAMDTYMQHWIEGLYVETDTGLIFTNSLWDEGTREGGIYRPDNGNPYSKIQNIHATGRYGVVANDDYIYTTAFKNFPDDPVSYIRRFTRFGYEDPFDPIEGNWMYLSEGDNLFGIAASPDGQTLYVSDTDNDRILLVDAYLMSQTGQWNNIDNPGALALDTVNYPAGAIWITQRAQGGTPASVILCDLSGNRLSIGGGMEISDVGDPRGLAVHPVTGNLYIADYSQRNQLLIHNANGNRIGTFGAEGGVYVATSAGQTGSPTSPGEIHPYKLNGPTGIGFDYNVSAPGEVNMYIATNGPPVTHDDEGTGASLRKYHWNNAGQQWDMVWENMALEFVDGADACLATDGVDVYTKHAHYTMDYNQSPGHEYTYKGFTLDPWLYPEDWRNREGLTAPEGQSGILEYYPGARIRNQSAVMIREILGQQFMFLEDQGANGLSIYKHKDNTELFIPSGRIARPGANKPDAYIWRDANGNFEKDYPAEFEIGAPEPDGDIWGWYVDRDGNMWTGGVDTGIRRYRVGTGLDPHGNPVYTYSAMDQWSLPDEFVDTRLDHDADGDGNFANDTGAKRIVYFNSTDTLFIAGFTNDNPKTGPETTSIGTEIIRYDNWTGSRSVAWRALVPYVPTPGNVGANVFGSCFDAYNELVVVGMFTSSDILVYKTSNGQYLTTLQPGPEIAGSHSWLETPRAVSLFQRSATDEYLCFAHDEGQNKILMFRLDGSLYPFPPREPDNPPDTTNGLNYRYYERDAWPQLPVLDAMDYVSSGTVTDFDFSPRQRDEQFAFRFDGYIDVPADGIYTFDLRADDGANLYIGDRKVVSNQYAYGLGVSKPGSIDLKAGKHRIRVECYQGGGGFGIELYYEAVNFSGNTIISRMLVPDSALYRPLPGIPMAPSNLVATGSTGDQIDLSWSDNAFNEEGFKIERNDGAGFFQLTTTGPNVTLYSDTGLMHSTTYTYRIHAFSSAGESEYSNTDSATTLGPPPPAPPTGLDADVDDGRVQLAWIPNTETNPSVLYYIIYKSTTQGGPYRRAAVAFGSNHIIDKSVVNNTTYYYRISAVNSLGSESAKSAEVSGRPHVLLPPAAPTNLSADAHASINQITLAWIDHADNELGFRIERKTTGSFVQIAQIDTPDLDTWADTGLDWATTYTYRIQAYNEDGQSDWSNQNSDTTPVIPVPEEPSNLDAVVYANNRIVLFWQDNAQVETGFRIERKTTGAFTQIATVGENINTYNDTGLSQSTTYTYRVRAYNTSGNSPYSNEDAATTPGTQFESTVDDAEPEINYVGNWNAQSGWSGRYLGTLHESSQTGAYAEFTFTGDSIQLIADLQPWGGEVDIYIDDQLTSNASFQDPTPQTQQIIFDIQDISYGLHTIKIIKTAGDWIYIDALKYTHY